jgi:hypothetical protein
LRFIRHFEGRSTLEHLLQGSGCLLSTKQVAERMLEAQRQERQLGAVLPQLFNGEPRFPDPSAAARLYGNLLGLWDILLVHPGFDLERPPVQVPPKSAEPPPPFGEAGPDGPWVANCFAYLEGLDKNGLNRLQHSFENRQDALLGYLEEQNLTDDSFETARQLLFELFAMIKLGWPPGIRSVSRAELEGDAATQIPEALWSYAKEVLFEAETDEKSPPSADEASRLRTVIDCGLRAIWNARRAKQTE